MYSCVQVTCKVNTGKHIGNDQATSWSKNITFSIWWQPTDAKITAYVLQVIPTIKQKQTQKQQCLNKLNLQVFFKKICNKANWKRH